ncbi:tetraacyldisaccharide 4'-kinase [Desulfuromonas sp.]|uniref:tetraacyldisaccharide 4'-kinase n=1 Tax=Desulfuromonas sp. TaxID=892 RepID=UPI0025B9313B|nr:tetraacyldisaccharide 4'-kinase [Desulfuromonas sp.]
MRRLEALHRRLSTKGPRGGLQRVLLFALLPFGWSFGWLSRFRAWLYRREILPSFRAPVPVLSVGNLAVGGTGKTPVVDFLVKRFLAAGKQVAVVSRGYGGSGTEGVGVVSAGQGPLLSPRVCGDEPFLLARRNPLALVFIAPRRAEGIRLAVEKYGAEIIVLDDGFQHLAVRRDLDIVLLDASRPLGNGHVLPAGILREFPAALGRGDLFLLTRCGDREGFLPPVPGPVLRSRHVLSGQAVSLSGEVVALEDLSAKRGVAFAGIADPGKFFASLENAGLNLLHSLGFSDHCGYLGEDLARLIEGAKGADYLVTTEKDGVKLPSGELPVPCYQVPMDLVVQDEAVMERALNPFLREGVEMAISEKLLELLACPKCKGEVHLRKEKNRIVCEECRLLYPIRDDIPVMLIDEAESF